MEGHSVHTEQIVALRRIEGQIRGIQKMIEEQKYCVEIVTQIHAVVNALYGVGEKIFAKHVRHCVVEALEGRSQQQKQKKIDEMIATIHRLHKI